MYLPIRRCARGSVESVACCEVQECCLASGSALETNEMVAGMLSLAESTAFLEGVLCRLVGSKAFWGYRGKAVLEGS